MYNPGNEAPLKTANPRCSVYNNRIRKVSGGPNFGRISGELHAGYSERLTQLLVWDHLATT